MSVTSVDKDFDSLTLTLIADFDAPTERVWQLWADPRQLERWWGPPTHPATMEPHDLAAGGEVTYFMTGPEGEKYRGWWRITSVEPPSSLQFTDGFADQDGKPNPEMPTITGCGCSSASTTAAPGWSCAPASTPGSRWRNSTAWA